VSLHVFNLVVSVCGHILYFHFDCIYREKPPLPMPGPRPPLASTEGVMFHDNADMSSESIL
jgi:hypothetical protein